MYICVCVIGVFSDIFADIVKDTDEAENCRTFIISFFPADDAVSIWETSGLRNPQHEP